jgi:hypothetical protein
VAREALFDDEARGGGQHFPIKRASLVAVNLWILGFPEGNVLGIFAT